MFETAIERHWGLATLAKRAPSTQTATIDPMLELMSGCGSAEERQMLHERNEADRRGTQPDPEAELLLKCQLRMYGQQPGGDSVIRKANLEKICEFDQLQKLSSLREDVTLPVNTDDDELLEKDAKSRALNAVEMFVLKKLNGGATLQSLIDFATNNGHLGTAKMYAEIGERLLESGLLAA